MLQCRRCKALGSKVDFSEFSSQQLRDHVEIHQCQSLACFGDAIHFEDCFSSTAAKKPAASSESSRHQPDFRIRRELGAIIARYASNGRVRCKICQSTLSFVFRTNAISHAMGHLNRDLFQCRICSTALRSITRIQTHLKKVHSANMSYINYVDRCEEHRKELIQIAEECFKPRTKESHNFSVRQATSIEAATDRVTPPVEESHNSGAHRVTSFESAKPLLVKIIRANQQAGTIMCNECKSSLKCPISLHTSWTILSHPMTHFDQWLFACKLCDHRTKTLAAVQQHGYYKHRLVKYKCLFGEHWSQLVEFTRKCYGSWKEKRIEEVPEVLKECDRNNVVANPGSSTMAKPEDPARASANMDSVEQQRQMHPGRSRKYMCPICNFSTSFCTMLQRHITVMHKEVSSASASSQ